MGRVHPDLDPDPEAGPAVEVVEIACDESGSEGEKLVGGTTGVFAHASVDVPVEVAVACIADVRVRARSPAEEVKASVVLRQQNRAVLEHLLGPDGPLHGRAHVHLTEKEFHLVGVLVALLGGGTAGATDVLHRDAARVVGAAAWLGLLGSFNDLLRARLVADARVHAARLFAQADHAAARHPGTPAGDLLAEVAAARPETDAALVDLLRRSHEVTVLDPLVPALVAAVRHWAAGGRRVRVVHDEHRTLRESGLGRLAGLRGADGPLQRIGFVDSRDDPRVQVADLLAGAARRIASEELAGRGDPVLTSLLRPYVGPASVWGDERSRPVLLPAAG